MVYRISSVPVYAGLQCFSDGRNFEQWTGDNSKALMKVRSVFLNSSGASDLTEYQVYLAAIAGVVPRKMVQCLSAFINACYIFCHNAITSTALGIAQDLVSSFHELCKVFIDTGVCASISLPHQHTLSHYVQSIIQFGALNGLCSSITESKHIKAVKEPWRRSSQFKALVQMIQCIICLDKMAAFQRQL